MTVKAPLNLVVQQGQGANAKLSEDKAPAGAQDEAPAEALADDQEGRRPPAEKKPKLTSAQASITGAASAQSTP
jgi:hypothetical protein